MSELEKIKDLQDRLQKIRVRDLLGERAAAIQIGINPQCLKMFIDGVGRPQFVTLAKIERFIKQRERD